MSPSFTKNKACREVNRFFPRYVIFYPMYFNALCWKIYIALLCTIFPDLVTYKTAGIIVLKVQSHLVIVTISAKTHIVCTSIYIREKTKFKIICEIMHACYWKIFTRIDGASNQWRKLQINKNYTPSYSLSYGEFENLCFISLSWILSVSCAFFYNAVDVDKISAAFFAKLPP